MAAMPPVVRPTQRLLAARLVPGGGSGSSSSSSRALRTRGGSCWQPRASASWRSAAPAASSAAPAALASVPRAGLAQAGGGTLLAGARPLQQLQQTLGAPPRLLLRRSLHTTAAAFSKQDYYELLGVNRTATAAEIKTAYYKLAKKFHPDANPGDQNAAKKFAELSAAYETLSDPNKRSRYDQLGRSGYEQAEQGAAGGRGPMHANPMDIFEELLRAYGGGMGTRSSEMPITVHQIRMSFDEAVKGTTRRIEVDNETACGPCKGTGAENSRLMTCAQCGGLGMEIISGPFMQYRSTCRKCAGKGRIPMSPCKSCKGRGVQRKREEVTVEIPPGVDTGDGLRINAHHQVEVYVAPSSQFTRDGSNIFSRVRVGLAQAVLGGTVVVPGLYGDIQLKVPPNTTNGKQLRLPRRGMPMVDNSNRRGDHFVTFEVALPSRLTERQKELLLEFAKTETINGTVEGLTSATATDSASSADEASGDSSQQQDSGSQSFFGRLKNMIHDACDGKQEHKDSKTEEDDEERKKRSASGSG